MSAKHISSFFNHAKFPFSCNKTNLKLLGFLISIPLMMNSWVIQFPFFQIETRTNGFQIRRTQREARAVNRRNCSCLKFIHDPAHCPVQLESSKSRLCAAARFLSETNFIHSNTIDQREERNSLVIARRYVFIIFQIM